MESKHGLTTVASGNNSKCHEADMQSSELGASMQPSVKSDISIETQLPLRDGGNENQANAAEDGNSITTLESQHMTESSSSNSLPVVLPVSLANQNYQETSKEAYLFRNCGSSMDSSNSKALDRSPEELVTASSESDISAQIASQAIRNAKARNRMKISSMAGNHSLLMPKKGDEEISHKWNHDTATPDDDVAQVLEQTEMYKWIKRNASFSEEQNPSDFVKSSVSSDNLDRAVENGPDVVNKFKGEVWVNEYSESLLSKLTKDVVKDQEESCAGFDLNEDINANATDDSIQPVGETASSHNVIHVVAKAGIRIGKPRIPLKFEGGLGWKGSAETSAFRPALLANKLDRKARPTDHHGPPDEKGFTGIDLNVAAVEDNDASEFQLKHEGVSSLFALPVPRSEADSKRAKSLSIDLNCLYDATDEFNQPSLPPISEIFPRVDLNLSSQTVVENPDSVHWLTQRNKISDTSNPGKQYFEFASHDYLTNLSTMRHLANSDHTLVAAPNFLQPVELMPRVPSTHPKQPLVSQRPPHRLPFKDPFPFSAGSIPYTRFYGGHTSFNPPHLAQAVHEQNIGNISASVPRFNGPTEDSLTTINGSRMDNPRQFPFLPKSSPMGERMHQEAWYAGSVKRKEPEGGLECYQLGYKQVL